MRLIDIAEAPDLKFSKAESLGKPYVVKLNLESILLLVGSNSNFTDPDRWEDVTIVYRHENITKILSFDKLPDPENWTTALCWEGQDGTGSWQPSLLAIGTHEGNRFTLGESDQRIGADILVLDP